MPELIRLIGYGLFAAGFLCALWAFFGHHVERWIDSKFKASSDWWDY